MASRDEPAVERFEVWPHRSLSRRGAASVLALLAAGLALVVARSPAPALVPVAAGAVLAFAVLALAFWASFRSARLSECVLIGPRKVRLERRRAGAVAAAHEFSTHWVRVVLSHDAEVANRLSLIESGRRASIGEFLSPAERQALAAALQTGLAAARRP